MVNNNNKKNKRIMIRLTDGEYDFIKNSVKDFCKKNKEIRYCDSDIIRMSLDYIMNDKNLHTVLARCGSKFQSRSDYEREELFG